MISYKDRAFCVDSYTCSNLACGRNLMSEDQEHIERVGLPVSLAEFKTAECGYARCEYRLELPLGGG